jgi:hypothetical protein
MNTPPLRLSTGRTVLHKPMQNGAEEAYFSDGSEMTDAEWKEYCALTLRRSRLNAEARDLQRRMSNNGFKMGHPVTWADLEADPSMKAAQSRLWYIGYALSHLEVPEVPV